MALSEWTSTALGASDILIHSPAGNIVSDIFLTINKRYYTISGFLVELDFQMWAIEAEDR